MQKMRGVDYLQMCSHVQCVMQCVQLFDNNLLIHGYLFSIVFFIERHPFMISGVFFLQPTVRVPFNKENYRK